MKLQNNKILITGGATGIGLGLAKRFIEENNIVIICGRRAEALAEAKAKYPTLITKQCDLTQESERIELFNWIKKEHNDLNVLVNNAGSFTRMKITDDEFYQKSISEINTNIVAPVHLTGLVTQLPSMNTIINVTSGLAYVVLGSFPVYCATKSFLNAFSIASRVQLKEKNIEVIELIPPAIDTDLGGVGFASWAPSVDEFVKSVFEDLKLGKVDITFGQSEKMAYGTVEEKKAIFDGMNS